MIKRYFIIIIPFLIILLNFKFLVYDTGFYEQEFEKNNVYEKIQKETAKENILLLIGYFKNKNELTTDFFSEKEKLHLKDVKNMVNYAIYLPYFLSGTLVLFFIYFRKSFVEHLFRGGILTIFLILFFLLLSTFSFNILFWNFHLLFFRNDYWLLEPSSNLIKLFPTTFFADFIKTVMLRSLVFSAILIIPKPISNLYIRLSHS